MRNRETRNGERLYFVCGKKTYKCEGKFIAYRIPDAHVVEKVKCHVNAVTSRLRAVFVVWWGRGALKNDIYLLNN